MFSILRSNQPFFFSIFGWLFLFSFLPYQYRFSFLEPAFDHPVNYILQLPEFLRFFITSTVIYLTALYINKIVNKSILFDRSYYLPGLIYIIISVSYLPFHISLLMIFSNLFLVLSFREFFKIFRNESCKNLIFKASCWLFISCLFYASNVILLPILFGVVNYMVLIMN